MLVHKFEGFVLHQTPLTSSRVILTMFTRSGGKRKGVFHISKTQPRAYLTPLNLLNFQLKGKEHQELKTISQVSLSYHNYGLASDYTGLILLQHWGFLIDRSQPEEQEDERVFRLMDHCLQSFRGSGDRPSLPVKNLYFEMWLLHFSGLLSKKPQPPSASGTAEEIEHGAGVTQPQRPLLIDPVFHREVFEQRIEDLARDALKLGSLTKTTAVLGDMWEQYLSRELKTRKLLLKQFREGRLI